MEHTVVGHRDWRDPDHLRRAWASDAARSRPATATGCSGSPASGVIAYRAADRITYLYPEAIAEAAGLRRSRPSRSSCPTGSSPSPFAAARARFDGPRPRTGAEPDHLWRLAYVARVVPIKGLTRPARLAARPARPGLDELRARRDGSRRRAAPATSTAAAPASPSWGCSDACPLPGSVNLAAELGESDLLRHAEPQRGPAHRDPRGHGRRSAGHRHRRRRDPRGRHRPVLDCRRRRELQACGIVIPPRDVRAMTEAIELLISDHDLFEGTPATRPPASTGSTTST